MTFYSTKRVLKIIRTAAGEPTKTTGFAYIWVIGESVLTVHLASFDPKRCFVWHARQGDRRYAGGRTTNGYHSVRSLIELLFACARVELTKTLGLSCDTAGWVYFDAVPYSHLLPAVVQPLAMGCLRGEVPAEMLLDAIKHDTDLLS